MGKRPHPLPLNRPGGWRGTCPIWHQGQRGCEVFPLSCPLQGSPKPLQSVPNLIREAAMALAHFKKVPSKYSVTSAKAYSPHGPGSEAMDQKEFCLVAHSIGLSEAGDKAAFRGTPEHRHASHPTEVKGVSHEAVFCGFSEHSLMICSICPSRAGAVARLHSKKSQNTEALLSAPLGIWSGHEAAYQGFLQSSLTALSFCPNGAGAIVRLHCEKSQHAASELTPLEQMAKLWACIVRNPWTQPHGLSQLASCQDPGVGWGVRPLRGKREEC